MPFDCQALLAMETGGILGDAMGKAKEVSIGGMTDLARWVKESDQVITF